MVGFPLAGLWKPSQVFTSPTAVATGPDPKLAVAVWQTPRFRPLGSQGHPKSTATFALPRRCPPRDGAVPKMA